MPKILYWPPVFFQKIGWVIFGFLYKFFVRLEIEGEKITGLGGPIIIVPNHTSELDVTAIPLIFPFFSKFYPIYFVSNPAKKYDSFGWRGMLYGGLFFNVLGGYPVFSGLHDYASSLQTHEEILKNGGTVCIFPEGKRTRDGLPNPARGGLGYLLYATKATAVPVAIDTFWRISLLEFILRRRKVKISVGRQMTSSEIIGDFSPEKPTAEDFRLWSQKVLDRVNEMKIDKRPNLIS
jgi:1-acyl-sn-glycerol-3-phosphate acyltransferase